MPPVVGFGLEAALPTIVGAASTLGAAALGSRANNKASKTQADSAAQALAVAQDNEKRRREEYDRAEAAAKAQWDAEQSRLAPYRAAKDALLQQQAGRLGLSLGDMGRAPAASGPPPGWTPGASATQPRSLSMMAGFVPDESLVTPSQDMTLGNVFNWGSQPRVR